ncbi:MAG: hypothetical protein HY775_12660 [Acidobacteria bacterium]|nr:hypothetical protein [Acidobacteriota bacterium]
MFATRIRIGSLRVSVAVVVAVLAAGPSALAGLPSPDADCTRPELVLDPVSGYGAAFHVVGCDGQTAVGKTGAAVPDIVVGNAVRMTTAGGVVWVAGQPYGLGPRNGAQVAVNWIPVDLAGYRVGYAPAFKSLTAYVNGSGQCVIGFPC